LFGQSLHCFAMNSMATVRPLSDDNMRGIMKSGHDYERLDKGRARRELEQAATEEGGATSKNARTSCCSHICRCIRYLLYTFVVAGFIIGGIGLYAGSRFVQTPARPLDTLFYCDATNNVTQACKDGHRHFLTPANVTHHIDFPDCIIDSLKDEMIRFNSEHDWKLVSFPSRQGKSGQQMVSLKAWWLPVKDPKAARVVVVHGNDADFNHFSVQTVAYLLRSIGFAVLLPNLRDHGNSGSSEHRTVGWGWDYHLDVLGAWDYAVNDPQGMLGAKMPESSVGIMGFGLGAFAASIALGLESRIPAVWLDSAIFRPREVLRSHISRIVGPFAPAFTGVAWKIGSIIAGVNITHLTPESVFSHELPAPNERDVFISHNRQDSNIPANQADEFANMFARLTTNIKIVEIYSPHARGCGGDGHSILPIWRPDKFRLKLCEFWSGVFRRFANECHLDDLPKFDSILDYASLGQQAEDRRLDEVLRDVLIVS